MTYIALWYSIVHLVLRDMFRDMRMDMLRDKLRPMISSLMLVHVLRADVIGKLPAVNWFLG